MALNELLKTDMGGISPLIDAARSTPDTPRSLVKLPVAQRFGEDDVATMEGMLGAGRSRLANLQSQEANLTTRQANLTTEIANLTAQKLAFDRKIEEHKVEQTRKEAELNQQNIKKMVDDEINSPGYKEKQRINKEIAEIGVFAPTEVTAPMLGVLFSVIGATGMLLGGNSKAHAKAALSAMNGMAEGFAKGREQYDKERKAAFDTNVKLLQTKLSAIKDGLEDARREALINKQAADQKVRETLAINDAQFLQQNTDKRGLESTIALVNGQLNSVEQATKLLSSKISQLTGQLDSRQMQIWMAKVRSDAAAATNERLAQQFAISQKAADERAAAAERRFQQGQAAAESRFVRSLESRETKGEKLSATREKKIDGLNSITSGLDKLKKDFKPEYAGLGVFGFGADLELEAARRGLGKKEANDAARWWGRYNQYQAPNRHALFGATLTGNELKNYQSFTAKPSDSAETVRGFIDDQINYSKDILDVTAPAGYKPKAKAEDYESTFGAPNPAPQPAAPQPGTGPYTDPDKERRYQDWKARQSK